MITINILLIYHFIVTNTLVNSQETESSICNPNLYTTTSCIDMNKTYKCKCNHGFIWNGNSCVSTALDSYFEFQEKSSSSYILYEKTFPKLNKFTLTTWLQIYNYLNHNDTKTLFTYSIENYENLFWCTVISNSRIEFGDKIRTNFNFIISIFESQCNVVVTHFFSHQTFWFHLAFTWNSNNGQINFFFNGELKSTCYNISSKKEIKTAGTFVLGQSHSKKFQKEKKKNHNQTNLEITRDKIFFFDAKLAFAGRIFNFNIWNNVLTANSIKEIYKDCKLSFCGTAVQWSNFRQGIKGNIKFGWSTKLLWNDLSCFNETFQQLSCNQYCNKKIGPICREQITKNILWPIRKETENAWVKCNSKSPDSKFAWRYCNTYKKSEYNSDFSHLQAIASWNEPNIENCVQESFFKLQENVKIFYTRDNFDESMIFIYLETLYQFFIQNIKLDPNNKRSIFDINSLIDTLFYLIDAQHQVIKRNLDLKFIHGYPSLNDTIYFCEFVLGLVDGILQTSKDSNIWSESNPIGSESIRLFDIVNKLSISLYDFQRLNLIAGLEYNDEVLNNYLLSSDSKLPSYTFIEIKFSHIVFQQQLLFHENQMPLNFRFPNKKIRSKKETSMNKTNVDKLSIVENPLKSISKPTEHLNLFKTGFQTTTKIKNKVFRPIQTQNLKNILGFVNFENINFKKHLMKQKNKKYTNPFALINVYYSGLENLVPNHNASFLPKDNNINSIVISTEVISVNGQIYLDNSNFNSTFDKLFTVNFSFLNNFNISDTRCVHLRQLNENTKIFKWSRNECFLEYSDMKVATCKCLSLGAFSITNDLYDPMWAPLIIVNKPLSIISYIGCAMVFSISFGTLLGLKYFRTKSTTASVHKNLCISICLSQILVIISLSKLNFDQRFCQSLALLNHYVLIAIFAWIMNEAFNLYITITYAAHQSSPLNYSGSQWKFYLLGWLIPLIIVAIIFLVNSHDYFDQNLCWFNLDRIWINVGPALSIIAISILVMIFSAKEHTEVSYTKTEKSNKIIANHTKAVWTQIVLMTLCWNFGLLSFILIEPTLKYLFAFFNCLQASFLFIFYFLLNEEIRRKLKDSKKLKRLEKKKTNSQMSNINDLIMEAMLKINRDENFDEEDDDEENEEEQLENKKNNSFSNVNKGSQKNKIESSSCDSKANSLWLKPTISKTVKFENSLSRDVNSNSKESLNFDNSINNENETKDNLCVWPQREKYYKNYNLNLNKFNSINLGADLYESNEEKITVL